MKPEIILGSQSPRRREILNFFSIPFRQISFDFDETQILFENNPCDFVQQIAKRKAQSLSQKYPHHIILTADTIVYRPGRVFLKPETLEEAYAMLRELSSKEHEVFTGVCVARGSSEWIETEKTRVEFCDLSESQVRTYAETFHSLDKAGGYAIQKGGSLIVKRVEGCYYNVMGLPLQTVRRLLLKEGIDLWHYLKSV